VDEGFGASFVAITTTAVTQFTHENLISGHEYAYRVAGSNLMGYGAYSAEFRFTPRSVPPKPPTSLVNVAASTSRTAIYVGFAKLLDNGGSTITSYSFYIDDGLDGTFAGPYSITDMSVTRWDTTALTLVSGRWYKVKYSASNVHGEGE